MLNNCFTEWKDEEIIKHFSYVSKITESKSE